MHFLHRNRYALLTVAVLLSSAVMTVQQFASNQAAHSRKVEDFLLLHERGEKEAFAHLYQVLVQQLPRVNEPALVQDLLRTAMVVDPKKPQLENLVWKYHVSVRNELRHRSEKRLESLLQTSAKE